MTGTATTATTQSYCTEVINARDFSNSTTDVLRDTWTVGKMYHVIKALEGRKVAATLDKTTGFTEFNVTLETTYRGAWGPKVRVRYVYDVEAKDGRGVNETDYDLNSTGMIMVMPDDRKGLSIGYQAQQSYREHCSAAIEEARKLAAGTGREWGTWKATPVSGREVDVTYTPSTGNPSFADQWGENGYWRITIQG